MATDLAVSTDFGSLSTYVYPGGYDQTKLGLGPCMMQANDPGNEGKWVGPIPVNVARPYESSGASNVSGICPDAISWSSTYDWVVLADNATATTTRRFTLYTFNKTVRTNPWAYVGFITATPPTGNTHVVKGHKISYEQYTTGTCYIANGSTTLNGSAGTTTWADSRIFAGSRIGIGSADPTQITTWYEISSITSNTVIVLTQNYTGTTIGIGSPVPYVIEDFRILFVSTNGTVTSSGMFMVAGLRYELFSYAGTTIVTANATDKVRACYWFSDGGAANNSNCQQYNGLAIDARVDWTHQNAYALDTTGNTNARVQVCNFRAAMSLATGRDSNDKSHCWLYSTGQQAVTGGSTNPTQSLVLCTPGVGGGTRLNGTKSLFFVTTTRFYGLAVSGITDGSTTFLTATTPATEIPPGNTGSGTGATITYTQSGAAISSVTASPAAGGTGYPLSSTIYLDVGGIAGSGGTFNTTVDANGAITAATRNAAGSSYPGSSTITLFVRGGTGGVIQHTTAGGGTLNSGSATIITGGSGYAATTGNATSTTGFGGIVTATTNGSGVVTDFGTTPVVAGYNYPGATGATTANCSTFAATSLMNALAYDSVMDRFLIFTTSAGAIRHYVTKYREDLGAFDRIILLDPRQINQSTEDGTTAIYPTTLTVALSACCLGGMTYLTTHGTSVASNFLYNVPFAADWEYAAATVGAATGISNCRVVLPVMSTSAFTSFVAGYFNSVGVIGNPLTLWVGGRTASNLGVEPSAVRMYYRTTGISDNSGAWTLLDYSGLMTGVTGTTIQAMLEFRVCTNTGLPGRVTRVGFEGIASTTDPHFQFSIGKTELANKKFVWRYATAFGTTVPTLYVKLYNGVTNDLLVSDDSVARAGTWETSTNGTSWDTFSTADRANETTYVRFTTTSSAVDNVNVLPVLGLS
jgi:hypothetical protein